LRPAGDLPALGERHDVGAALVEAGSDSRHSETPLIHLPTSLPTGHLEESPAAGRFLGSPGRREGEDARILQVTDGRPPKG
jgi:hypothetical protein